MKKNFFCLLFAWVCAITSLSALDISRLPRQISSGPQGRHHVQGIAYDEKNDCIYMSFTTTLIKMDLQGHVLGSVQGLTGHLGCMALNPDDGRLYASLEYKHDGIGKGIGTQANDKANGFYVAIFDVDRITRPNMDAAEVMTTVYIREAVTDYEAKVINQGKEVDHRHGCSGIDGLAIAPKWGKKGGRQMLYTSYGVYGDNNRTDNDYQVILCYDISKWKKYEQPLSSKNLHSSGPEKPNRKYFVRTGNTTYGIQNLAYDKYSGHMLAAVYPGKKAEWPNYNLFVIDGTQKPKKTNLHGFDHPTKGWTLSLLPQGEHDAKTNTWGFRFPYGSTGICSLGDDYFYVSHPGKDAQTGQQCTTLYLYKWNGGTWSLVE